MPRSVIAAPPLSKLLYIVGWMFDIQIFTLLEGQLGR
jgi:hypothetical protein